ncbi:MAG: peptidase T [Bacteroidota bacterium]|nr:peptidase T [Bacteroidota bacterium]
MFQNYSFTVAERFIRYAQIDTQSDPDSKSYPSTDKQKDFGRLLVRELHEIGITDAGLDEFGYVFATVPANTNKQVPVICFCAHVDTSPDCSGKDVKPIIHRDYDGGNLEFPDDPRLTLSPNEHPYLQTKRGEDIITASGTTLLGADDKAGIAVIMDMANYLMTHPECRHGRIRILFTPDEEIGRGVDKLDLARLGADFAYTLDAGERGSFEEETFSADGVRIVFHGVSTHPGYAKDKLVNALKVAAAFLDSLPKDEWSPETTEGRYGFVHPVRLSGGSEKASLELIVRDFVTARLAAYEEHLRNKLVDALAAFPGATADFEVTEQYRNMKEVLDNYPQVSQYAEEAIGRAGVPVRRSSARGGTDGSRLSFMGLPCPNLFTGEMAFHGRQEFVSIQDMQKSVETIVHLAMIWEENA